MPPRSPALRVTALDARLTPSVVYADLPALPDWPQAVVDNVRRIADLGHSLGRNPNAFMKVGDSNTATPGYLTQFGDRSYNPAVAGLTASHPEVLDTLAAYRTRLPSGDNSFSRRWGASHGGWQVPNALKATPGEVRAIQPAAAVIMLGSNDQVVVSPEQFRERLLGLVDTLTGLGVVPILCGLPLITPSWGRDGAIAALNQVVAEAADARQLPYYNPVAEQRHLTGLGLYDGIHLNTSPRGGGQVAPADLAFGQNLRNLITLEALDRFRDVAFGPPGAYTPPPPPAPPVPPVPDLFPWDRLAPGQPVVAAGAPAGSPPVVRLTDPNTGRTLGQFLPYAAGFTGGVRVAVGDVDGDGVPDVVTAPASGGGPNVKAFSGVDGRELLSFWAFEPAFTGGVSVAVGDADGDGKPDIVTGAGAGGGPRVRVFRAADLAPTADFFAFEPTFVGGVNVAVGDFGIAVGPGAGGGAVVKVFDAAGNERSAAAVGDPAFRGGMSVAAGDVDGDGRDEVVTAPASDGTRVRVLTPAGDDRGGFDAGGPGQRGVRVAVVRGLGRIVVGTSDGDGTVSGFDPLGARSWRSDGSGDALWLAGPFVGG